VARARAESANEDSGRTQRKNKKREGKKCFFFVVAAFFPLSSSLSRVCVRACEALCGEGNDVVLVEAREKKKEQEVKLFAIQEIESRAQQRRQTMIGYCFVLRHRRVAVARQKPALVLPDVLLAVCQRRTPSVPPEDTGQTLSRASHDLRGWPAQHAHAGASASGALGGGGIVGVGLLTNVACS
jgi:hypothetical protein